MNKLFSTKELIRVYHGFLETIYTKDIKRAQSSDDNYLIIDLMELCQFDTDVYDAFLENPEEHHGLILTTLEQFYDEVTETKIKVRYTNLSDADEIMIHEIRNMNKSKLFSIKGMVKRKSNVLVKTTHLEYLCTNPSCAYSEEKIVLPQIDDVLQELKVCPKCKSGVELINEKSNDYQQLMLEEIPEMLNSSAQPQDIEVILEGDLTNIENNYKMITGSKVEVIGFIKKKSKKINGKQSTVTKYYVECLNIIPLEDTLFDVKLTDQDIKDIKKFSELDNLDELVIKSFASSLYGLKDEKLGCILGILGGSDGKKRDGLNRKSKSHICIFGDPAQGKSKILRFMQNLMPRTIYVSGEGSSAVGLTATAVKDEFSGGWTAEAGAIVHANNGYLLLDELDKIKKEEQTKLNTALEDGTVKLAKAGLNIDLNANTTCFAVANPKHGKFDICGDLSKQMNVDPTLLSRFDLVFVLLDKPDIEKDNQIVDTLFEDDSEEDIIDINLLRKYLVYSKNLAPKHTKETKDHLKQYYNNLRQRTHDTSINITIRQLEGLKRLSEAHAKLYLRNEVSIEDCQIVINLMQHSLKNFGVSEIETGVSNKKRSLVKTILDLFNFANNNELTLEEIKDLLIKSDLTVTDNDILKELNKLKIQSEIFEPKKNFYKLL